MANNPYVNKVQTADGTTIIDISDTTAVASDVAQGTSFYTASGQKVAGASLTNGFVITFTYNSNTDLYEPDKTIQEISTAYNAGLPITGYCNDGSIIAWYQEGYYDEDEEDPYHVLDYTLITYSGGLEIFHQYGMDDDGIWDSGEIPCCDVYGLTATASEVASGASFANSNGRTVGTATRRNSSSLTASGATVTAPAGFYASDATKTISSGTEGTPTATKGAVNNHSIAVTPSVTNTAGYIAGGTKTGTAVTVTASELVSGSQTITTNNTYDVTNLAEIVVSVSGGGGGGVTQDANGYIVLPSTGGGGGSTWSWMGENPTLVKDYGTTKVWLKDTGYATWTPTTTSTKIEDYAYLETYTGADFANYDYIVWFKFHSHFEYGSGATGTAQAEDCYYTVIYHTSGYWSNYSKMVSGDINDAATNALGSSLGLFYLNASGNSAFVAGSSGVFPYTTYMPTVNSTQGTIAPRVPQINAQCSTAYFSTANASVVDQDTSYYEHHTTLYRVDRLTSDGGQSRLSIRDMWLNGI